MNEYEVIDDTDLMSLTAQINNKVRAGWRVHTFTSAVIPATPQYPPMVVNTVLLERPASPEGAPR